jgi:hypothetical protein
MSPTHVTPEKSNPVTPVGLAAQSRMVAAANINDAMRDQLEFLIEHAHTNGCACDHCHRYQRARSVLLDIFG